MNYYIRRDKNVKRTMVVSIQLALSSKLIDKALRLRDKLINGSLNNCNQEYSRSNTTSANITKIITQSRPENAIIDSVRLGIHVQCIVGYSQICTSVFEFIGNQIMMSTYQV